MNLRDDYRRLLQALSGQWLRVDDIIRLTGDVRAGRKLRELRDKHGYELKSRGCCRKREWTVKDETTPAKSPG